MMSLPRLLFSLVSAAALLPGSAIIRFLKKPFVWSIRALKQPMIARALASVLLCILGSAFAVGQVAGPVPAPLFTPRPVPPSHLYWHFLMSVTRNDRLAEKRDKQGRNGAWLHNFQQHQLGWTDEEFAPIRTTAQRLEADLKELDAQAKALIDTDHTEHPLQPETHAGLKEAREQHKAEFDTEVTNLRHALGPSAADRLDIYIQTHIDPKSMTDLPQPPPAPGTDRQAQMFGKYSHFLRMVDQNDRAAAMIERRGQGGSGLRNSLQNALGFNDGEFALIRESAQRVAAEGNELFVKERAILSSDPSMQTHPPEIRALSQKREDTIANAVSDLQHALGSDLSARLDAYIHAHLQSHEGSAELDSERTRVFQMETSPSKK
jgi:hypothetical protein